MLALTTFRRVEKPLKNSMKWRAKTPVLVLGGVVLVCCGLVTYYQEGWSFRRYAALQGQVGDIGHIVFHKFVAEKYYLCQPKSVAAGALKWDTFVRCMQSKPIRDPEIVLLGDSHAEHLFLGVAEALSTKNVVFYIQAGLSYPVNPFILDTKIT